MRAWFRPTSTCSCAPTARPGERAIRPLTIGRKNRVFPGSSKGGQIAATVFGLIQTCKEMDINAEA
jgi:hypothetical protein